MKKKHIKRKNRSFFFRLYSKIKYSFSIKIVKYLALVIIIPIAMHVSGEDRVAKKHLEDFFIKISKESGLVLKDILLDGYHHTPKSEILDAILASKYTKKETSKGEPILLIDISYMREKLEALPWIKYADIERILPSTIKIHILEHKPMAILQNKGELKLISYSGYIIKENNLKSLKNLIIVIGNNAIDPAIELFKLLNKNLEIKKLISSVAWIGERRWDITLYNGIKIKMPENNLNDAWLLLTKKHEKSNLLKNNVRIIDFRINNKIFVTP